MARVRLTVSIDADQMEALRHVADDAKSTMSDLAEVALEEMLREPALFLARVMTHRQQRRYDKQPVEVAK